MRGIHIEQVSRWLVEHVAGATAPFEFELIAGGRSNLTYRVTDAGGTRMVLRRPPLGSVLATAHDMAREHRIVSAVGRTDVPVPPVLGLCTDVSVNDAPFYVMAFVDGAVLDGAARGAWLALELRRTTAEHLFDVLADLHDIDVDAVGLGDLAKREGYVERQVRRWSAQWEQSKTRELPAIDEVARLLRLHMPVQQGATIAHGDYRFGNCLVDLETGRVNAVLDWELCTLGDPLADVGYVGVYWHDEGEPPLPADDPTAAGGFPTYAEMVQRYARRTGRDVSQVDYYVAFGCWRIAVISEGVYARFVAGAMGDQDSRSFLAFKTATEQFAQRALVSMQKLSAG